MALQQTYQLADFEKLLNKQVKVVQKNKLNIVGKLLDVIPDENHTGLHKLNIEQRFIISGNVGIFVRESKLAVATVYTRNVMSIERIK